MGEGGWAKNGGIGDAEGHGNDSAWPRKAKVERGSNTLFDLAKSAFRQVGWEWRGAERVGLLRCPDVPPRAPHLWAAQLTHPFLIKAVRVLSLGTLAHQLRLDSLFRSEGRG